MLENNLLKHQLYPSIGRPAKSGAASGVKLIFIGMLLAGLALVVIGAIKQLNTAQTPSGYNSAQPQTVALAAVSGTPGPNLLSIPSLKLSAPFEPLGLKPDRTIEVPKNAMAVGWFVYGAKPGEMGASVVVGHLDSIRGRAIFADLSKIKVGDKILIKRTDGSVVTYKVDSLSKFSQDNFPTQAVYGAIPYAGIRLITCTGVWNKKAGHYSENLVVFGSKI